MSNSDTEFCRSKTLKAAKAILRSLSTPYADNLLEAINDRDWDAVMDASFNPSAYQDADSFALDYLAYSLLRKLDCFPGTRDTQAPAMVKFLEAEESCRLINHYRGRNPFVPDSGPLDQTFEAVFHTAKVKISEALGPFSWDEAADNFGFSGGASTRLPRKTGHPFYKYQGNPETTRNNALLSVCSIWTHPLWVTKGGARDPKTVDPHSLVTVVEGSRVTTVPKTSRIDRTIAIEPEMNMYVQRGIGAMIRKRLRSRRCNIDLNDQSVNQRLAQIGAKTGSLSTIDLASASDSVSLSLVEALLPADWFSALLLCRSERGQLPTGEYHLFEKISSMGNGYTFELESLIFWGLSKAVCQVTACKDTRIGIYGDDIVVHNSYAARLIEVLEYAGFQTNTQKTFISGPFRESCGKHYFYEADVTPFAIKHEISSDSDCCWIANSYRAWCAHRVDPTRFQRTYKYLVSLVPKWRTRLTPPHLGFRAGLVCNLDEACPRFSYKGTQGWVIKVFRPSRRQHRPNGVPAVLAWFAGRKACAERVMTLAVGVEVVRSYNARTSVWDCAPSAVSLVGTQ